MGARVGAGFCLDVARCFACGLLGRDRPNYVVGADHAARTIAANGIRLVLDEQRTTTTATLKSGQPGKTKVAYGDVDHAAAWPGRAELERAALAEREGADADDGAGDEVLERELCGGRPCGRRAVSIGQARRADSARARQCEDPGVDARAIARSLADGRAAVGAACFAAPELTTRAGIGDDAGPTGAPLLAPALGAREVALGAAAHAAVGRGAPARPRIASGAACDAVDLTLTLLDRLPVAPSCRWARPPRAGRPSPPHWSVSGGGRAVASDRQGGRL